MKLKIALIFVLTSFLNQAFGQTASDSLLNKLISGNDAVELVLDIYRQNKSLTEDSLNKLLSLSNKNYLLKDKKRKEKPDLQFRQIMYSDQLYRTKCYSFQSIDYRTVQKNDSVLQISFLKIVDTYPDLNPLTNSTYQMTFDLLLLHSVTTLQTNFFVNNFCKYAKPFNNNFKDYEGFEGLKGLVDNYLKFQFEKQYFGTAWGAGKLPNGSFGLLPKMTDSDFKKVLSDLKVNNAVY